MSATPRLYLSETMSAGVSITLAPDQAHYLATVLRLGAGAPVRVFNGRDGEWDAQITQAAKRAVTLTITDQRRAQTPAPDVHLLFAPLKRTRTDFVVEKATELGVAVLRPVFTARTSTGRVNTERLAALAREAAEQTERLDLPALIEPQPLEAVLSQWETREPARRLVFCDEGAPRDTGWSAPNTAAPAAAEAFQTLQRGEPQAAWAILIGPEGGFSPEERARLYAAPFAQPISLGPRILRAETAALAALALWQSTVGDWRGGAPKS